MDDDVRSASEREGDEVMTRPAGLERHPDIMELRAKYERAGSSTAAQAVEGCTLLSGLYLAISPWVVGFTNLPRLTICNLITGFVLAALAVGFASAYGRTHGLSWIVPIIGVWTIIVPWVVHEARTGTIWSNVVTGAVILLLGLAAAAIGFRQRSGSKRSMDRGPMGHESTMGHERGMPGRG